MTPGPHRECSKALFGQVRSVLNREWDPIGVYPQVEDEYDSYALKVARLLIEGTDAPAVATRLMQFERDAMGYERATADRNLAVARKLLDLDSYPQ